MAKIRDYTVTEFTSTAATWEPDEMPVHESGDLLIALLAKDSTTGFSTSSGWTSYIAQNTAGAHLACQAKRATSSSETFSVTLTTETGVLVIIAVQDCYGTTLADAWDLSPVVDSADRTTNPFPGIAGQSATYDNSLIIRAMGGDAGQSHTAYPPNVNLYNGDAGQGGISPAYTFQKTAGTIAQANWYGRLNNDDAREMLMAVRAGASGLIPAYSDPAQSQASFIRALGWATTNTPFADTWPTSITLKAIGQPWEQVWVYTGTYADETIDMNDVGAGDVGFGTAVGNILYFGHSSKFVQIGLNVGTAGVGGVLAWEYWNGGAWATIGVTENLTTAGARRIVVSRAVQSAWGTTNVNGDTKYWIRARITTAYTTAIAVSQGARDGWGTTYDVGAVLADAGTNPYADGMSHTPASSRLQVAGPQLNFASAQDMDTGIIIGTIRPTQHRDGAVDPGKLVLPGGGLSITFADASSNYESFIVYGRDALDVDKMGNNTYAIDWNGAATEWAWSPSSVDKSAITQVFFGGIGYYGAIATVWSMLCLVSKICIAGGSSDSPINFDVMDSVFNNCVGILPVFRRNGSQALIYAPLQIGGGDPVYASVNLRTFAFPPRYNLANKYCTWNAGDNVAGIKFYPQSGDTIKFTNCLFTSDNSYRWEFDTLSATSGATIDFSGTTVVNAQVSLEPVGTFSEMTFTNCSQIQASDCTLSGCTISGAPSTGNGLTVNSSSTITNCEINTTTVSAGNSFVSTGTPDDISGCNFTGSASTGHAIVITQQGTFTFSGNTFTGYGADGTTSAAIYNDSAGLVTLNISGGSTPTVRNGAGASTTINNAVTLEVNGVKTGTEPTNYVRCRIEARLGGSLPVGTQIMNEEADQGPDSEGNYYATEQFNYTADQPVTIRARYKGYIPFETTGTITSNGLTVTAVWLADLNYTS